MTQPIRIAINGASGRMGRSLIELIGGDSRFALQRAVVDAESQHLGRDASAGLKVVSGWGAEPLDVVVDFSTPQGLAAALEHCQEKQVALVTGTTGLDDDLEQRLQAASEHIAILRASNFSLGVAVLTRLLRDAAAALPDWDLEIIEAHHARKEDAPSGTALSLGRAAAMARGTDLAATGVYSREGITGPRPAGSIGFTSIRAADIVGEHTALLATAGERLELTHRATDRSIFARGALDAAAWLATQKRGAYSIENLLDDRL